MDVGQLHTDEAMTNVSIAYRNAAFVAELVFPEVPVDRQSAKYHIYGRDNLRPENDTRRPGDAANEILWSLSEDTYYADGHALSSFIPDEWRENSDLAINLDVDTTEQLTDRIDLNREANLVAALAAGMTVQGTNLDNITAAKWDTKTTPPANDNDPIADIEAAKDIVAQSIARVPNVIVFSRPVFSAVRHNTLVTGRITGAGDLRSSSVTAQQLADLLEIPQVIVADAIKVTSAEGQTTITTDWVWGKTALLLYCAPSPGLRTVSLGYHMMWNKGRLGSMVYRGRNDVRHSDYIEAMKYYDQKIVAATAGMLFTNCIA